jgi:hypothetical protein
MSHPSSDATAVPAGSPACLDDALPLTGKRGGNPDLGLAPRCGARTRFGGPCPAPAIGGKLRRPAGQAPGQVPGGKAYRGQAPHGGRSTDPRTQEGLARLRAARTIHGDCGAEARARNRFRLTVLRISRIDAAATSCQDHLPPAFAARLHQYPPELRNPPRPIGGITAAEDRDLRHAVAEARAAARAAREAASGRSAGRAEPHAPVRPRRRPAPRRPGLEDAFAALVAELHALVGAAGARGTTTAAPPAAPPPGRSEPHAPERRAGRVPPVVPPLSGPHAPERGTDAAPLPTEPHAPERPAATAAATLAAPPSALVVAPAKVHAPERAAGAAGTAPAARSAAPLAAQAKAHAPEGAAEAGTVIPAALGNRAARRRWQHLQKRLHRTLAACAQP